eukprot:6195502-Pleurochrysis_carterae.AAC.1
MGRLAIQGIGLGVCVCRCDCANLLSLRRSAPTLLALPGAGGIGPPSSQPCTAYTKQDEHDHSDRGPSPGSCTMVAALNGLRCGLSAKWACSVLNTSTSPRRSDQSLAPAVHTPQRALSSQSSSAPRRS